MDAVLHAGARAGSSALRRRRPPRASAAAPRAPARRAARWPGPERGSAPVAHALDEVPALDPQRLLVGDLRAHDVARARDVLAVVAEVAGRSPCRRPSPCARAPCRRTSPSGCEPDDREAPLLVRVEPRQVHVRDPPGGKAQVAEDDVLDAVAHERLAAREHLLRLLAVEQVQQHRDVVRAEAPERVLVLADLAEVEPVRVDVVDVAELAGVDDLLQLARRPGGTRADGRPSASGPAASAAATTSAASAADWASGFSTKQCLPAARTRAARAARARGRRSRPRPRRARGRRAARPDRAVKRVAGKRALASARAPPRSGRSTSAARSRRARRSCAPGSGPSSRGRRRRR